MSTSSSQPRDQTLLTSVPNLFTLCIDTDLLAQPGLSNSASCTLFDIEEISPVCSSSPSFWSSLLNQRQSFLAWLFLANSFFPLVQMFELHPSYSADTCLPLPLPASLLTASQYYCPSAKGHLHMSHCSPSPNSLWHTWRLPRLHKAENLHVTGERMPHV